MPPPAKIAALPDDVRQELHVRVIDSGFTGYKDHSEWLKSKGHDISHMAVWRYFENVREEVRRELLAISVSTASVASYAALQRRSGDDFALASQGMLQRYRLEKLREALDAGEISLEDLESYERLERGQGLTRLRAARERHLRSMTPRPASGQARAAEPGDRAAAEEIAKGGDPVETIKRIRREVYGIFDD